MADLDQQDNLDEWYTIIDNEKEQTVNIPITQYTDWMLKAHTLSEIKKIYDKIDDEKTVYYAIGALLN